MPVLVPTFTPSGTTHVVAGNSQLFTFASTAGSAGVQKDADVTGFSYEDQSGSPFDPSHYYALASVTGIRCIADGEAHGSLVAGNINYAMLADGTGPGTPAPLPTIIVDYNPPADPGNFSGAVAENIYAAEMDVAAVDSADGSAVYFKFTHSGGILFKKQSDDTTIASGSWVTAGSTHLFDFGYAVATAPGVYSISVFAAKDGSGLAASTARTYTITINARVPVLTFTSTTVGVITSTPITITPFTGDAAVTHFKIVAISGLDHLYLDNGITEVHVGDFITKLDGQNGLLGLSSTPGLAYITVAAALDGSGTGLGTASGIPSAKTDPGAIQIDAGGGRGLLSLSRWGGAFAGWLKRAR